MQSIDKKGIDIQRIALVAGATGVTGKYLLKYLHHSGAYSTIIAFTRKPLDIIFENLDERIVDFDHLPDAVFAHDVYCCLGTTIKKAKTKEAFKKVDHTFVINLAEVQKKAGTEHFAVISAMGASSKSPFFYNRVKGEMENALMQIGFKSLYIFRPSFIAAHRTEKRSGEKLALLFFSWINPLLIGPLKKYQSVAASAIAKAMALKMLESKPGIHLVLSDEIKKFT